MRVAVRAGVALLAASLAGLAGERKLELRGRLEPAPQRAVVILHGATSPFTASTFAGSDGRFRFRNLQAGAYTISVVAPGEGEVRQTIEVTPSFADSRGRIEATILFRPTAEATAELAETRHKVSVRQLAIPERAAREYREALTRLGRRDVPGAIERLERAVELAPQFAEAWNTLGTIAYQTRRYQDAERYFRRALEQDPGSYSPLVNLGGTLISLGRYRDALPYNLQAVRDQPGDALARSQLGRNWFYLGDEEKALHHLKEAQRLDPSHFSQPQLLLAQIYLRRGDRGNAARELEDLLARHPDDPNAPALRRELEELKRGR